MTWKQLMGVLTLVVVMFSTAIMVLTYYNISGFERLEARIESRIDRLESKMDRLESRMDRLEGKIDQLDDKVDGLSNEVAEIKGALKAKGIMANR